MSFLREVTKFWGNTTVIESDPGDEICSGAVYVPFPIDTYFEHDPSWGVYHPDGRLVQAAAYYRGPSKTLLGQTQNRQFDSTAFDYIDEEFDYGGPVITHYGHFLTAALPRLWHLRTAPGKRRRILCHSHGKPEQWFTHDYIRDILWSIGLTAEDFVTLEHPSVIKRLRIQRPAMEEQNFIHRAYDNLAQRVGRYYGVHRQPVSGETIYLSKTRLSSGITRFQDEHILEAAMAERGVSIIHPQEFSFPDQLRLLARAKVIVSTAGSALHSCLFLDKPSRIIALVGHNAVNSNYILIDRVKRNDSLYLYPTGEETRESKEGSFASTWMMDMKAAAEDVAARL
jgi:capsular polysaccharide biosynthesis protein